MCGGHFGGGVQDWRFPRRDFCRPSGHPTPGETLCLSISEMGAALPLVGGEGVDGEKLGEFPSHH